MKPQASVPSGAAGARVTSSTRPGRGTWRRRRPMPRARGRLRHTPPASSRRSRRPARTYVEGDAAARVKEGGTRSAVTGARGAGGALVRRRGVGRRGKGLEGLRLFRQPPLLLNCSVHSTVHRMVHSTASHGSAPLRVHAVVHCKMGCTADLIVHHMLYHTAAPAGGPPPPPAALACAPPARCHSWRCRSCQTP